MPDEEANASSAPEYLLLRDPNAYSGAWSDRRLRRIVLITGSPIVVFAFPFGVLHFLVLTWYAGGFRCPRCRERFARRRVSLLLRSACATCSLPAGSKRDLGESPMFPRLFGGAERRGVDGAHPGAKDKGPPELYERGDENNPFRPPASD